MLRNDAYWFSRLGVIRADNTAHPDVKYHLPLPANERVGGLIISSGRRSCARVALTAHHWVYREMSSPG
jgi:hypothetical protein